MLKRLVILTFVLVFAVWIGLDMVYHPGYVSLYYRHWTVTMPLWFTLAFLIILMIIIQWLGRCYYNLFNRRGYWRCWYGYHQDKKLQAATQAGLMALATGQWQKAQKGLLFAATKGHLTVINYLAAAIAAQQQRLWSQRDNYLQCAYQIAPKANIAIALTQAQLQLHAKQTQQALATLQSLKKQAPKQLLVIKLLHQLYLQHQNWESLYKLLPILKKHKLVNTLAIETIISQYHHAKLSNHQGDITALKISWQKIPNNIKQHALVIICYIRGLLTHHHYEEAINWILKALNIHWHDDLSSLLLTIETPLSPKHFSRFEQLLVLYPKEPKLLLMLGKLSANHEFWGKAQDYLQRSIDSKPTISAYGALGQVYQTLGQTSKACQCYQKGLALASQDSRQ